MIRGGAVMNVTYNKTDTLRAQTHGHEPIVLSIAENQQACVTLHEEKANCISVGGGGEAGARVSMHPGED